MATYIAHYRSPESGAERARGLFEYESAARAGSKRNNHDARVAMLELFGNEALPWVITKVELKRGEGNQVDGQMELDFREPLEAPKRRRTVERGKV